MLTYRALRSRLNNLDSRYHVPFSEESAPLIERLVTDLVASDEGCRALEDDIAAKERDVSASARDLQALRQENPRLLKENTELHKRVLINSQAHEDSRRQWDERLDAAGDRLSTARAVQQQSEARATELQRTLERLRGRVGEMQRLGASHAGEHGGPRQPSIVVEPGGGGVFQGARVHQGPPSPGAKINVSSLVERADDLSASLAAARQQRATKVAALGAADAAARAAREEVERLGSYTDGDALSMPRGVEDERLRVEQSQLKSQENFLDSECRSLQKREERLSGQCSASQRVVESLRQNTGRIRREVKGLRQLAEASDEGLDMAGHRELVAGLNLERRQLEAEHDTLTARSHELEAELSDAEQAASTTARERSEGLQRLREKLDVEIWERPTEQLHHLEHELQAASEAHAQRRAACADLSARLAATRTHCDAQRRLLSTRDEEMSASQRAQTEGEYEAQSLDSQLHDLEAGILSARGEVATLRGCLEEASERHSVVAHELQAARAEAEELRGRCEREKAERSNVTTEVEQARASIHDNDARLVALRAEGDSLHAESERLRGKLWRLEECLASLQRGHRELSSSIDQAIHDRRSAQAARQAELSEERRLDAELHRMREDVKLASSAYQHAAELRCQEALQADRVRALALEASDKIVQSEASTRQGVLQRIQDLDPNLAALRGKMAQLRQENPRLLGELRALRAEGLTAARTVASAAGGAATAQRGSAPEQLAGRVRAAEDRLHADRRQIDTASAQVAGTESQLQALADEKQLRRRALVDTEEAHARVEQALAEEAGALHSTESAHASAARRLREVRLGSRQAEAGLEELQARQGQLTSLLRGYESTHEQLAHQVREETAAVRRERASSEEAGSRPPARAHQLEVLAAERERLQHTIASVERDHAELGKVVSDRGRELDRLRLQVSELQATQVDVQWAMDKLRHTEDAQHGELAVQARDIESAARQVEALEAEVRHAQAEAEERRREANLGLEDLLLMTRENQLLHDELTQITKQDQALAVRHQEQSSHVLPRTQQALRGTEVECQQILRVYQEAIDERRRNEIGIAELAEHGQRYMHEIDSIQARFGQLQEAEGQSRARLRHGSSELATLRQQLSTAARSLEMHELACGEAEANTARTMQRVARHQADASERFLQRSAMAAEVDTLRANTSGMQEELSRLQATSAWHGREVQETAARQAQLQRQIAEQRLLQRQLVAERASLHRPAPPTHATGGCSVVTPAERDREKGMELTRRMEQQDRLIEEMEAERKGLDLQVRQLREELAEFAEPAGSSGAAGPTPFI